MRGVRQPARRGQRAVPERGVPARLPLDQGGPPAPADPARDAALARAPPGPRGSRARVRQAQERVGVLPLRVRGLERVQLHADLTILAKLSCALARVLAAPLAA